LGFLALVVFLGSALVPRWAPLRRLDAERRLQWMAALCLLGLVLLRLSVPAINRAILAGANPSFQIHLVVTLAGIAVSLALGLGWSPAVDDSRPGGPRTVIIVLFLVSLIGSLLGQPWLPVVALPVATRTGWSRGVAEQRHPLATLIGIAGFVSVLAWPSLASVKGDILTSGGPVGASLFTFARIFLAVQLGMLSMRYALGLIFGPRRIGRRLLVSHMLAGLVPVALLTFFAVLIALLALASFRSRAAIDLLNVQHNVSEEMLARAATETLEDMGIRRRGPVGRWSPELLSELAVGIRDRWPAAACWGPHPPAGERMRPEYIHVAFRSPQGGFAVMSRGSSGDSLLVPVYAWLTRPEDETGCGLVKIRSASLHVADCRFDVGTQNDSSWIRIQLVERLPGGRVRALDERLDGRASIEELFRYRLNERGGLEFVSGERPGAAPGQAGAGQGGAGGGGAGQAGAGQGGAGGGGAGAGMGGMGLGRPGRQSSSVFNTGTAYRLMPAQEWVPRTRSAAPDSTGASTQNAAVLGEWGRIRLAVLGIATPRDLVPAIPAGGTPVEYFPIFILAAVMLVFVGVESFAFFSALRMGRSIAQSVGALRFGTERLRHGDLSHRIQVSGRDELANLGEAFNEMAVGLEEGRRTLLEKERLESELALARQIQQRLLPAQPPRVPGLQLAGVSVPAREVGGDYYDFLPLADGRVLVALADVSGKGAPAALLMSSLRASLHSMLDERTDLARLAGRLNKFVHASTSSSEFITLFFGMIDGQTGRLAYVNAGHEYPFLVRSDGHLERLTEGGLIMGAFADAQYTETIVQLKPGDLLFLFTDGLTDARGAEQQMFAEERCEACLREHAQQSPDQLLRAALDCVDSFVGGAEAVDDITLVAIRKVTML
jgi:hypothetical protein